MKATNNSNQPKKVEGVWFKPGETKEVDISEDRFSYHFTLEDDTASETEEEMVKDEKEDEKDDEEDSKSEEKQDNEGE